MRNVPLNAFQRFPVNLRFIYSGKCYLYSHFDMGRGICRQSTNTPHALILQLKQMEHSIRNDLNKDHYVIPREIDKDYEILGKLQVFIAYLISEFSRLIKQTYIYLYIFPLRPHNVLNYFNDILLVEENVLTFMILFAPPHRDINVQENVQ